MTAHKFPDQAPPADRRLLILAGVLLLLPMIALVPVGWYAKTDPKLGAFPFFIWYQLGLVFVCACCTSLAYVLVKKARPHVPFVPADAAVPAAEGGDK